MRTSRGAIPPRNGGTKTCGSISLVEQINSTVQRAEADIYDDEAHSNSDYHHDAGFDGNAHEDDEDDNHHAPDDDEEYCDRYDGDSQ